MASFNLQWSAPEFQYRNRDVSWYWITIIIAAALVAFSVWQRDFLFGLFVIIAEILAIVWANQLPRMITFSVSDRELVINGKKHYPMSQLEAFSNDGFDEVEDQGIEFVELMFHFKGRFRAPIFILVPAADLETIKQNLKTVIREVDHEPTFIDSLERWIGF